MGDRARRRLAAIVAADVAGYSRLVGQDEEDTLARLKALRLNQIEPLLVAHSGRIFKTTGDGFLMEFGSAVDAVRCTLALQRALGDSEAARPDTMRLRLRIGVHVGDVVVDGEDLLGDGVNVAARLEQLAEPGGICLSARAIEDVRGRIEIEVQDIGEQALKNIERPVRVFRVAARAEGAAAPSLLALPDRPSIAVLPFQNMSGDPEQEYFCDGLVEDVITALSRFHGLFVIARNSSFAYKGQAVDVKRVSRELGVRYVLEGSVRKSGQKVRITGQLIDGTSGAHIWADRFDGTLEDIFDLQDQVTMSVVGAIEPKLRQAEIERSQTKRTENLDAYDHLLRAYASFHSLTREGNVEALSHLSRALALDPRFALAAGLAAWCYVFRRAQGWAESAQEETSEALRLVGIVANGERRDPLALAYAAQTTVFFGRDYDTAVALIDHALKLNTNSFSIWNIDGWIRNYTHDPSRALASFTRAHRLNPLDPLTGTMMSGIAYAHWFLGNFEESLRWARQSVLTNPKFTTGHRTLIFALVSAGRLEEARSAARELLRLDPTASVARFRASSPFRKLDLLEEGFAGLRAAGIPE